MYTDFLIQIKNAQHARKETCKVPFSNMNMAIAEVLVRYGYLESAVKKGRLPKRIIEAKLKYDNGQGVINGLSFISKPSKKVYSGYDSLRPAKHGYGLAVISTSKGIMATKEARRQQIGGELLFEIW